MSDVQKVYTKADVEKLLSDVAEMRERRQAARAAAAVKADAEAKAAPDKVKLPDSEAGLAEMDKLPLETSITQFGLALDVRDPVSGKVFTVCRPEKDGQVAVPLLTAEKLDGMIEDAHKTVLAGRIKEAERAMAEAKVKDDQAQKAKDAAKAKAEQEPKPAPQNPFAAGGTSAAAQSPRPPVGTVEVREPFADSTLVDPKNPAGR